MMRETTINPAPDQAIPIWVPDPSDPSGVDGTWMLVEPDSDQLDDRHAAQAIAIAALWAREDRRAVA